MKPNLTIKISALCLLQFFFTSCAQNVDFSKLEVIPLANYHIINESGCGDALYLVDEYTAESFTPHTFWKPKERSICADERSVVLFMLDTIAQVKHLYVYAESSCEAAVGYRDQQFVMQKVSLAKGWNTLDIQQKCKYLKLELSDGGALGEVVLEGNYLGKPKKKDTVLHRPTFDELMGTNAFVDDPQGILEVVQNVREYHESSWHQKDSTTFNFAPSYPGFEFDLYYANLAQRGATVTPVLQHSAFWLTGDKNTEVKPMEKHGNTTEPHSYAKHSHFVYEFVKNYKEKGLNMPYVENWNEPDKWWHGNTAYMSPFEYAAMSSQDWDAHGDTSARSICKASPTTKLVMAGLSDLKADYVNALKYWCDEHRGGQLPWAVVNAHVYANDPVKKKALAPEVFQLDKKVASFVANARINMPQTQVWLTEFGYDRNADSPQAVSAIEGYTSEQVQAIWLLRSFLLLSGTGLDKAFQYMIRDSKGTGLYTSSGLYKINNGAAQLAEAWYYVNTLRQTLGGYHFSQRIPAQEDDVYIYEFEDAHGHKAYAVWAGVEGKKTYKNHALKLGFARNTDLTLIQFGKTNAGSATSLKYENGFVQDITEKPIVLLSYVRPEFRRNKVPVAELKFDPSASALFDEQSGHDPLLYPHTKPSVLHESKACTIDFNKPLSLAYVCLFDDQGQSEITLEVLSEGHWMPCYKGKLSLYQKWKTFYIGKPCTALRISHLQNTSKIGELVLYE